MFNIDYWILFLIAGGVYLIFHILQGVGLYVLSNRAGYRHAWMAFIPFLNSYLIGKLAGDCSFFGQKVKRGGVYYALSEGLCCIAYGLYLTAQILLSPYQRWYDSMMAYDYVGYPEKLNWAYTANTVLSYIVPLLQLIYLVFTVIVLFGFFRKYAARNSWIFTVVSVIFPVKGAFIFAVRKNTPVNYEQYMRAQREEYYRRNQQYYNRPNNSYGTPPYGNNPYANPYNNTQHTNGQTPPDDLFEEFSNKDDKSDDQNGRSENDEFFR